MNSKLKELMLEAGYATPELAGRANKLAKLLVQECAGIVSCNSHVSGFALGDLLRQHFGIQE